MGSREVKVSAAFANHFLSLFSGGSSPRPPEMTSGSFASRCLNLPSTAGTLSRKVPWPREGWVSVYWGGELDFRYLRLSSLLTSAWAPPYATSSEAFIKLPLPAKEGRCPVTYTDCKTIAIMETTEKTLQPRPTGRTGGRRRDPGSGLNHSLPTALNAQAWEPS